ncbi:hypothetical protein [Bacillus infantis]|uniref:hypothetical protein n=1 Tax=Bacillus infantis TaxID=324767 RepID=UPI003CEA3AFE
MGIFTKDLSELVAKVKDRETKINSRVNEIKEAIAKHKIVIDTKRTQLVEAEINNDSRGIQSTKDAIKKLKEKVAELNESLESYKANKFSLLENELQKVKEAGMKERQARHNKLRSLRQEQEKIEKHIEDLQKRSKELSSEIDLVSTDKYEISQIEQVLAYIEPRATKLSNTFFKRDKEMFISAWLEDGDTEQYLAQLEPQTNKGLTVTYGEGHNRELTDEELKMIGVQQTQL